MEKKPRLGRGLDALLGDAGGAAEGGVATHAAESRLVVSVEKIKPNPNQPRKLFDEEELLQLSESIRNHGILQPLVVRGSGDMYELIAGERRLRAAKLAGLSEIPVSIVDFTDQQVFEAALVENMQRTDLNAIEKAQGFKEYLDKYGLTQEALAQKLGLDRSTVSNFVNLLSLPMDVQNMVRSGSLSLGHAKLLKGLNDPEMQIKLAKETVLKSLSVRALETLMKEQREPKQEGTKEGKEQPAVVEKTPHVLGIEDDLRRRFAVKVAIKLKERDKGQIVIGFDSNDDFERIIEKLRAA